MNTRRSFFKRIAAALAAAFSIPRIVDGLEVRREGWEYFTPNTGWKPSLSPIQQKVFDDNSLFVLAHGAKCAGKKIACLHALVRHCHENKDAFAIILCESIRSGKFGIAADLEWVLDIWKNGNWKDEANNIRSDAGIGLDFTPPGMDAQTKDRVIFIGNRFGGWSKVLVISLCGVEGLGRRIRAMSPSFIYHHDATDTDNDISYFNEPVCQLGRRSGIDGRQQYYASGVPAFKSHWTYKKFLQQNTPDYSNHHFTTCWDGIPESYRQSLLAVYRDPIERARLLEGKWV